MTTPYKRKLIEVSLPLEAINRESAREKSIRHGHPSTLHLWWARRPLAACRAVLFAQLVDDPSAHPERFPTEEAQAKERQRLFDLIERLVVWENAGDERLMREAYDEIAACFDGKPPAILDPFCGGGSIPLEAQRLGLEAHASDLNPVAVLITKALIEIPPRWAGHAPVFPGAAESKLGGWPRATGLAEDVRRYGAWMRDEAERRIGHLYPKATLPDGSKATVIAWIWARTVTCPNPACGATMPLVSSLWLSKKRDRRTWLKPVVSGSRVTFDVAVDPAGPPPPPKVGQGAVFRCLACDAVADRDQIHAAFRSGRHGAQLLATVAEGHRRRVYLPAVEQHAHAADVARPADVPDQECRGTFGGNAQGRRYGFDTFADYFTNRQLVALTSFSELVREGRTHCAYDARSAGRSDSDADSYADAVATYLALVVSRLSDYLSSMTTWASNPQMEILRNTFARQAIAMTWDFAEGNPFAESSGSVHIMSRAIGRVLDLLPTRSIGSAVQTDARHSVTTSVVATDPPYYDNIGYADSLGLLLRLASAVAVHGLPPPVQHRLDP